MCVVMIIGQLFKYLNYIVTLLNLIVPTDDKVQMHINHIVIFVSILSYPL